jgi:hypothetical protein
MGKKIHLEKKIQIICKLLKLKRQNKKLRKKKRKVEKYLKRKKINEYI